MCSIVATFDVDKFDALREINTYRGSLSHSLAVIRLDTKALQTVVKSLEKIDVPNIVKYNKDAPVFLIGHSQAPTSKSSEIHPSVYKDTYLWHNGLIKDYVVNGEWDTAYLCKKIYKNAWWELSSIDGSFACAYYDGGDLYIFRNKLSPLFMDDDMNFSSTGFKGSYAVPAEKVYHVDLNEKKLEEVFQFRTHNNPYDF